MKVVKSLIFILFALCSLSGKAQEVTADSTGYIVRVGGMAPNFTITLTDGKKVTLSELRGKGNFLTVCQGNGKVRSHPPYSLQCSRCYRQLLPVLCPINYKGQTR